MRSDPGPRLLAPFLLAVVLFAAACSGNGGTSSGETAAGGEPSAEPSQAPDSIHQAIAPLRRRVSISATA